MRKKVFLGGTCNDSDWRDILISHLEIDYFDPVVIDWTEECQEREIEERQGADIVLYVITPKMKGVYSIAEVVDDSNKRPEKTVFAVLSHDWSKHSESDRTVFSSGEIKSLNAVGALIQKNGGTWVQLSQNIKRTEENATEYYHQWKVDLEELADFLNSKAQGVTNKEAK